MIVGMLATKDSAAFLHNFSGLVHTLIAVPIHQDKTLPPDAVAQTAHDAGIASDVAETVEASAGESRTRLGLTGAAAHPDRRFALSRRRGVWPLTARRLPDICIMVGTLVNSQISPRSQILSP